MDYEQENNMYSVVRPAQSPDNDINEKTCCMNQTNSTTKTSQPLLFAIFANVSNIRVFLALLNRRVEPLGQI